MNEYDHELITFQQRALLILKGYFDFVLFQETGSVVHPVFGPLVS